MPYDVETETASKFSTNRLGLETGGRNPPSAGAVSLVSRLSVLRVFTRLDFVATTRAPQGIGLLKREPAHLCAVINRCL
jgi:hypothetical protein